MEEKRDNADVTEVLKALHRIVNEAIAAQGQTFAKLLDLARNLDAEQRRAVEEGLTGDELALFDLLQAEKITKTDREKVKQASRDLLAKLQSVLRTMEHWILNAQTQAEVETMILDHLYVTLPRPPFTDDDAKQMAARVYDYVWQRSAAGVGFAAEPVKNGGDGLLDRMALHPASEYVAAAEKVLEERPDVHALAERMAGRDGSQT